MTRLAADAASAGRLQSGALEPRRILLYLVLASAVIIGTVLITQYWGGLQPCELCYYERWPYYAAIVAGLLALPAGRPVRRPAIALIALMFAAGSVLAFYHVGVEQHWFAGPTACTDSGTADSVEAMTAQLMGRQPVMCDQPAWTFHGLSLAAFNLLASLLLTGLGLAGLAPSRTPHLEIPMSAAPPPRRPAVTRYLPGDPDGATQRERMIRVDHAGEYGARQIYRGQLAILGRTPVGDTIRHMAQQEERHLKTFEQLIVERQVRPTVLHPFWHAAGFVLGAATALMGERAAMACTVAVEEVIDEHYQEQIAALGDSDPELSATMEEFRAEEVEHRDIGLAHEAEQAAGYEGLTRLIKAGSRAAIWLSQRF